MCNNKKYNKKMEKKNYEFKAFTSNGREIELKCPNIFYDYTEEEAKCIRMGIEFGLFQKYKDPMVIYREI